MDMELEFSEPRRLCFHPHSERQREVVHQIVMQAAQEPVPTCEGELLFVTPLEMDHTGSPVWTDSNGRKPDVDYIDIHGDLERFAYLFFNAKVVETCQWLIPEGEVYWTEGDDHVFVMLHCGQNFDIPVDDLEALDDFAQIKDFAGGEVFIDGDQEVFFNLPQGSAPVPMETIEEILGTVLDE